jgi:uncharacterized protein
MQKIRVVSQKYNGALRDEGESYLYYEDKTMIIAVTWPGTPYFHHKKDAWLTAEDGSIDLYFKGKWYNVWHICEQNSRINHIYANIAMPATLQDNVLTWVDLDLDLRVHLDESLELLDEDEFVENSILWAYPSSVIEQARTAVAELVRFYHQRVFPFNHAEQVTRYERIKATILQERLGAQ